MPKKGTFTSRFEETRGGRVHQKSKIWGDVFYGWSLIKFQFQSFTGLNLKSATSNYRHIDLKIEIHITNYYFMIKFSTAVHSA